MLTMQAALERAIRLYGTNTAIVDVEGTFTWAEFVDRARRAATVLQIMGVRRGDRYGIICRNSFRHAELIHAGYWMGAVPVPVNFRLAPAEVKFILEDSECKLLAFEDVFADVFSNAVFAPWHERALCIGTAPDDLSAPAYETALAGAIPAEPYISGEDDDAILLYTGGTTGRGKGVRLSHLNVYSNGMQVAIAKRVQSDDIYLHVPPMFHSADLLGTAYTLQGGGHAYLPAFSGQAFLQAVQDYKVTHAMLAPTMIILTLTQEDLSKYDLSSFGRLFYGSSPMAVEWIKRSMEAFPTALVQQGYGLTETSPILTTLDETEHREALRTGNTDILRAVGRPLIGIDLRIVDDDDNEVPTGEAGEVVVRGPNVTKGYLNRPEENERAFRNGWFHTGDIGKVDEKGYMYLLDRKKDMVITGGENVYTSEVEAAIYKLHGVQECAVIGVPDEKYGEALYAVIVPAAGASLTETQIIEHCRQHIGGYKIPRKMAFVQQMPKSAMGKILKTELRKSYGSN